jgi:hypothetical protein
VRGTPLLLCATALAVGGLTGCASPAKSSDEPPKPRKRSEYVYVTVTGSHIPVKVPREYKNRVKGDGTVLWDPEALDRMLRGRPARP